MPYLPDNARYPIMQSIVSARSCKIENALILQLLLLQRDLANSVPKFSIHYATLLNFF